MRMNRGAFLMEYCGEVIDMDEFDQRAVVRGSLQTVTILLCFRFVLAYLRFVCCAPLHSAREVMFTHRVYDTHTSDAALTHARRTTRRTTTSTFTS
jgi:hypothetical protein